MYAQPVDVIWDRLKPEAAKVATIEMHFPTSDTGAIEAALNADKKTYWQTDYRFYDQYTLKEIPVSHVWGRIDQAKTADKIFRMNYDIHTGRYPWLDRQIHRFLCQPYCWPPCP